ncbi:BlaI/MecI/CopY family transcriptional regulator [Gynurincola endophyticus]|jgi:BlaI family penicillinase repressor|uniref:BlaI/MecI/CopY family transcriptional regulator n=1 Tax=Gynurincola endophyticus TaxID=2479004 RepID=UPI000F8CC338|nr:BlaI/MecI/CopY family transcriptional regulator [Gynurincola endophyticus]
MQKLAPREEQIMQAFWKLEKAFIKEIIPELPDPKPHYNSVATIVKILEEKGFLSHEVWGNMYKYYPLFSKEEYQKHAMKDVMERLFDNSSSQMLAFFAKEEQLSEKEINEILQLIKSNKK